MQNFLRKKNIFKIRGGYGNHSLFCSSLTFAFNFILGCALFIFLTPLFLLVVLLVWFSLGPPIIYKGQRMGKNKKIFKMFKFRTLPLGADKKVGSELLSYKHNLTTPLTQVLRDTRLDEMPQLFNIIRNEMNFIGPRPIRPEVYNRICHSKSMCKYDNRFKVKPGLIGYAQLFTPHNAPKKIRSNIDNHFILQQHCITINIKILLATAILFFYKAFYGLISYAWKYIYIYKIRKKIERRRFKRRIMDFKNTIVKIYENNQIIYTSPVIDINETHICIKSNHTLPNNFNFKIKHNIRIRGKLKTKTAYCTGKLYKMITIEKLNTKGCIIEYKPVNDFSNYIIEQYILLKSFISL